MCPPQELNGKKVMLWKLQKLRYGITEARRQWATFSECLPLNKAGLGPIQGVSKLCIKEKGSKVILAKLSDDLLLAGTKYTIDYFSRSLDARFELHKTNICDHLSFK